MCVCELCVVVNVCECDYELCVAVNMCEYICVCVQMSV